MEQAEEEGESPVEKPPSPVDQPLHTEQWRLHANPLRGKSLGIFSPTSRIRTAFCDALVHPAVGQIVLGLIIIQTVLLAVESAPSVFSKPREMRFGLTWFDWALFGLFTVYSLEIAMHIVVSGFIINPVEYSTINRGIGFWKAFTIKFNSLFAVHWQSDHNSRIPEVTDQPHDQQLYKTSLLRSWTGAPVSDAFVKDVRHQRRLRLAHRAYLRHSWNRLDFLAVVSYWISFSLSATGIEDAKYIYAFRMLGCLRILRLLGLTSGTSVSSQYSIKFNDV